MQIDSLINTLENHNQLTQTQWHKICHTLDTLINNVSDTLEQTCKAQPILQMTNRTSQQGSYLKNFLKHGNNT